MSVIVYSYAHIPLLMGLAATGAGVRLLIALAHERTLPVLIHAGRGIPALGLHAVQLSGEFPDARDLPFGCHGHSSFLLDSATNEPYPPNIPTATPAGHHGQRRSPPRTGRCLTTPSGRPSAAAPTWSVGRPWTAVCSEPAAVRIRHCTVGVARPLERRSGGVAGKDPIELGAGADPELEEHLAQVVLDRTRADE